MMLATEIAVMSSEMLCVASPPKSAAVDLRDPSRGHAETQGTLPVLTPFRSTFGYAALVRCAVPSRPRL